MAAESPNELLVGLLHEASQLEHCLLNAYLYAACSLKSHPEEFATLPDGRPNRRRAIQFERTRAWKQSILHVAQEEMAHLHYVQCLIRALGEAPYFDLPERDPNTGSWLFGSWRTRTGDKPEQGMEVPVEPLTPAGVRRFVVYESTDTLQDDDPLGPASEDLFKRLHAFELDLLFESALLNVDGPQREPLKRRLTTLYTKLTPAEPAPPPKARMAAPALAPLDVGSVRFQSIADLYNEGILPLYQEAFDFKRVPFSNLDFNAELQNPEYAAQGFLPVGPVKRDKNFDAQAARNVTDPLRHYKDVREIVGEIVEEGEGLQDFEDGARALLAEVQKIGGACAYLQAVLDDEDPNNAAPTPDWLADAQRIRLSHLYQFAVTMVELDSEIDLAKQAGVEFEPARTPLASRSDPVIDRLAAEAAEQFNVCYLALIAWLARLYEVESFDSDRRRRMGIEMLASWPMMSIAIRPFLELLSFLPVDRVALFRTDDDTALPSVPLHARQLLRLYRAPERSEDIYKRMDYYALHALSDVARWAAEQRAALEHANIDSLAKRMMRTRLGSLAGLDEFEPQFPYREHGGYCDRAPDLQYQIEHPGGEKYEETPRRPLFEKSLVLRVRFAGRGLVQLATDPDPPTDEVGVTGTHMLHAADGDRWFDRALIWQPGQAKNVIVREPRGRLPPVGVRAAELTLMVTGPHGASGGYVPIAVMQSTGAVQTSGVQQRPEVQGLQTLITLTPEEALGPGGAALVDLCPRDGVMPYLNGYNHLVWQDGEPIDPFIISVSVAHGDGAAPVRWLQREIFNDGRTLMQMDPLQRLLSSRGPSGFDSMNNVPGWALALLSDEERRLLADAGFPMSYLEARAHVLRESLTSSLHAGDTSQEGVDAVVSFMERLRLVAVPRGTTIGWLTALLHYGHTVSGTLASVGNDQVLHTLSERIGAALSVSTATRGDPNGRWMVTYCKGMMDTDALSDLVFGELYVPLTVQPTAGKLARFERSWRFVGGMEALLAGYACQFHSPFWATFDVHGDTRTVTVPGGGPTIVETLRKQDEAAYSYSAAGVHGITGYTGSFAVTTERGAAVLTWSVTFIPEAADSLVQMLTINAGAAETMGANLAAKFGPSQVGADVGPSVE